MRAQAVFYDGASSTPQQVEVLLEQETGFLVFSALNGTEVSWHLKNVEADEIASCLEIKPKSDLLQSLKVEDSDFISLFKSIRKQKGYVGLYQKMVGLGLAIHAFLAIVILGFIGLVYFFVLPWVAENAVAIIPDSYDDTMGSTFFEQYVDYSTVDSSKTAVLNEFAAELQLKNTRKIHFTVVNSDVVNAFALPDGNIVVYTGILDLMEGHDELAGLIGHEVAHVNNRHSMKMLCRNLAGYLFLSAVLSDVNGIMAVVGDNVHQLQSLTYSRRFEHEADEDGLKMLVDNRVNPKGMSKLFTRLQTDHEKFMPEFLSSHPVTGERIKFIDETISKSPSAFDEQTKLRELFRKIQ